MRLLIGTSLGAFALSFLSKIAADAWLTERIPLIGDVVGLQPSHNPGIAFGVRFPPVIQEILIIAALAFVLVLAKKSAKTPIAQAGFGLIAGGALGNICDRAMDGLVTDFFQVGSFPIFNVADSCITVGVLFLLADAMKLQRNATH